MKMIDFYELSTYDIGGVYFIPDDIFYFHSHFICKPMADSWTPPAIQVVRKRAKPADFSSWMLGAPIVRERVCNILLANYRDDLELLPFYVTPSGERLFAVNVLTTERTRPVFKIRPTGGVCVREEFGMLARDNKFTGLALANPDANNLRLVVSGQDINAFPGLVR